MLPGTLVVGRMIAKVIDDARNYWVRATTTGLGSNHPLFSSPVWLYIRRPESVFNSPGPLLAFMPSGFLRTRYARILSGRTAYLAGRGGVAL